jgi:hypothetical protein
MTYEAHRFTPTASIFAPNVDPRDPEIAVGLREQGYLPLHEGKTFHQYDDHWDDRPRYCVALTALADKPEWLKAVRYYRLAFRDIASSTNERTAIFCLVPPGCVFGNTAPCERKPEARKAADALVIGAVTDAYAFDWTLRQKNAAHVNLFILNGCPFPNLAATQERFFAHGALRLTCNHAGYAPLWGEQVGDVWREPTPRLTWPVLAGDDTRWAFRAAIDAVVAQAYGLSRDQYAHVLGSFSHRSYPKAPELCLAAFDELTAIGLEAFCQKHDPYWDIPLNENLPEPVIDLPIPGDGIAAAGATVPEDAPQYSLFGADGEPASPRPVRARQDTAARQTRASNQIDDDTYQRIAALLAERGVITSSDAQQLTGLDAAGVRPYLTRLVDEGRAVIEGQRRGTRYRSTRNA